MAVLFLNSSTLNLESNVYMAFVSNSRAILAIHDSTLNVVADTSMFFVNNSKIDD